MALKDAQGNEITEPIAPEKAEEMINASVEQVKKEYEKEKRELQKKIDENTNEGLRKKTEKTEKEKEGLEKQMNDMRNNFVRNARENAIAALGISDEKAKEKLAAAYERLKPSDETDTAAVASAMRDAWKLSSDIPSAGALNRFSGGHGGASPSGASDLDETFTPEVRDLGRKMGVTDEDIKKFGKLVPPEYRK